MTRRTLKKATGVYVFASGILAPAHKGKRGYPPAGVDYFSLFTPQNAEKRYTFIPCFPGSSFEMILKETPSSF